MARNRLKTPKDGKLSWNNRDLSASNQGDPLWPGLTPEIALMSMYHSEYALLQPNSEGRDPSGARKSISVKNLCEILDQLDPDCRICINITTCNLLVLNKEYDERIGYIDLIDEDYYER